MSRDPAYLLDILQAARRIREGLGGVAKDAFLKDWMRHSAVVRQIEIIGEATKRLSEEFRNSHHEIPWRSLAGDALIRYIRYLSAAELRGGTIASNHKEVSPSMNKLDAKTIAVMAVMI